MARRFVTDTMARTIVETRLSKGWAFMEKELGAQKKQQAEALVRDKTKAQLMKEFPHHTYDFK